MFAARLARALVGGQRAQKLVREAALPLVRACAANCGPLRADASDDDHGRCFLPHCAAAVDVLARTHGSLFLERYEDRSLLGLVAVAAAPNLGSPDARTAVDVALQLRDRGEARAKGPEWSRFRDLAKEFIGRVLDTRAASIGAWLWDIAARRYRTCWWRRVPSKIELTWMTTSRDVWTPWLIWVMVEPARLWQWHY